MKNNTTPKIIVSSFNCWYMDNAAKSYEKNKKLVGLYNSTINNKNIDKNLFHRAWLFHLAMKPFYFLLSPVKWQQVQYKYLLTIFDLWFKTRKLNEFNVMQAIAWGAKAPFDVAEKHGALKVLDAPNSYPTNYDAIERREMALWSKKVRPSVPEKIIEQVVRDIERADIILCPSKFVYDSMINNGVDEAKCRINYFGVDNNIFIMRNQLPSKHRFVCVGSICLRKGHQYLFRAYKELKTIYPEIELYCIGEVLDDFKDEWKIWKSIVTFQGTMPQYEIAKLFQETTAFVLASVEEGFARAIIEAMAAGLPIIATYESGATTLIDNGEEGIIIKSRSVTEIMNAMQKVIVEPLLNIEMGKKSYLKGGDNNSWNDYGQRSIDIFTDFLNK